jgi:hypothetical protein
VAAFCFVRRLYQNQFYSGCGEFRIGEIRVSISALQSHFYNYLAPFGTSIFLDSPTTFLAKRFAKSKSVKAGN